MNINISSIFAMLLDLPSLHEFFLTCILTKNKSYSQPAYDINVIQKTGFITEVLVMMDCFSEWLSDKRHEALFLAGTIGTSSRH